MSNKNINVNAFDLVDYYKVNIKLENKISSRMIVQIILPLLFLINFRSNYTNYFSYKK